MLALVGTKLQSIKCWSLLHSFEDQGGGIHHTQKKIESLMAETGN